MTVLQPLLSGLNSKKKQGDVVDGWIKLHRKFLEWQWYDNPAAKSVFLHLLLTANIDARKWHGIDVKRGQVVTSFEKISKATGHSIQEVRTAVNKLKSTQCVTQSKYSKFSVFTVINYDSYQSATEFATSNQQTSNKQATGKQQASNNNIRIKEGKERKEEKELSMYTTAGENPSEQKNTPVKKVTSTKKQFAEFVSMTDEEYSSLVTKLGEQGAKQCIEILDNYKGSSGKTYKSDYRTILNWVIARYEEEKAKSSVQTMQPPQVSDFDPNDPYKDWGNGNV